MYDPHARSEASTSSTPEVSETVYPDVNNASLANLQIPGRTLGLTRQQYDFYTAMPGSAALQGLLRLRVPAMRESHTSSLEKKEVLTFSR